jgi:RsiW-degrading membrane proteinase PrsW (M82 family)
MLEILLSLALATIPGFALALAMYIRDHHEPEPLYLLVLAFSLGAAAFLLGIIPGRFLQAAIEHTDNLVEGRAVHAFATVAFVEELLKFLMLRFFLYPNKNFNEPLDGIVYAVMVGLGFASAENLVYIFNDGAGDGLLRMFSAIPAHAIFAVIMGYYLGIARFTHTHEVGYALLALLSSVFLHGAYDFFLFASFIPGLWTGAVISLLAAGWMAFRSVRLHQKASPFYPSLNK